MGSLEALFEPVTFGAVVCLLVAGFILVSAALAREQSGTRRRLEEERRAVSAELARLSSALEDKERRIREAAAQKAVLQEKEKELETLRQQLSGLADASEILRGRTADLERRLSEKETALQDEVMARSAAEEKLRGLENDTDKIQKDLQLSNQMYEGLKGQYDELEEKFSQVFQQFLQEQKKNRVFAVHGAAQKTPSPPAGQLPSEHDPLPEQEPLRKLS